VIRMKDGVVGSAYLQSGFGFTITAAGTMTAGDHFHPVVTDNNVAVPGAVWAVDGCDAALNSEIRIS
jgi:hypothetical protein